MIIAHIKSTSGDRDEEWEDNRISPADKHLLEEFTAYVIGFENEETHEEQLVVVAKYYWDLNEEAVQFMQDEQSDFPQLTAFTQETLRLVGNNFREFLDIEKRIGSQGAVQAEECAGLIALMTDLQTKNEQARNKLGTVLSMLVMNSETGSSQITILKMLNSMASFTEFFAKSVKAVLSILEGLKRRGEGGDYQPLEYLRDLEIVRKAIDERQETERSLTASRTVFNEHVKQVQQ